MSINPIPDQNIRNVLGERLASCCFDPITGFFRDGFCHTGAYDLGQHTVCAQMTSEFLTFSQQMGNDLSTPLPEIGFAGLQPGDFWCICVTRWKEAFDAGFAPPIKLQACHERALDYVPLKFCANMPSNPSIPLILASSSVTRHELLSRLHLSFDVISPHVDETPRPNESASDLAWRLAQEKAAAVATQYQAALVIGSDQVVWREGAAHELIGKPLTHANACQQLLEHSGKLVHFETALSIQCQQHNIHCTELVRYSVKFRELSLTEIQRYVEQDQPLQCAGSFKCESLGISLFDNMHGDDFTALMGLPLIKLCSMLRQVGWQIP